MTDIAHAQWSRPPDSAIPNRPGNDTAEEIYCAIGWSLTQWECLEASLFELFAQAAEAARIANDATILAFSATIRVSRRAELVRNAINQVDPPIETELDTAISAALVRYVGWSARRNEVAHGCVTLSQHPDYASEDQEIVTSYSLCPPHGDARRWGPDVEPEFNYIGEEIRHFGAAFATLDQDIATLAHRLGGGRLETTKRRQTVPI